MKYTLSVFCWQTVRISTTDFVTRQNTTTQETKNNCVFEIKLILLPVIHEGEEIFYIL